MAAHDIRKIDKRCILIPVSCNYIHMIDNCGGYLIPVCEGHSQRNKEFIVKLEALLEEYTGKPASEIMGL